MGSSFSQAYPPKPRWTAADIPDLSGKVVLVTGANIGIGKETAKQLLAHNATVYIAARDKAKADAAIAELGGPGKVHFLQLDLADLHSVKRAAEEFLGRETKLNVLFASAGVMMPPIELLTKQGYDLQLGTNVLGHWYFTSLLLPALRAGAREDAYARVVTLSSIASEHARPVNWDSFTDTPARKQFGTMMLYAQSKLLNVVVTREFAKRYAEEGVVFSAVNPGNIKTGLTRHMGSISSWILDFFLHDVSLGALTSLYVGTSPEASTNGAYYIPWARLGKATPLALDQDTGVRAWEWMEEQVKAI